MIALTALLALLIWAAVRRYPLAKAESRDAARFARFAERMDAAMTDDHQCDLCAGVSAVREMVALHDDYALCCVRCAELLKGARVRQGSV